MLFRFGERVRQLAHEHGSEAFDLSEGKLLRGCLIALGEGEHVLLMCMHHIVSDGWSIGVLVKELAALYAGQALEPLQVQYADYGQWQRRWLVGETLQRQQQYWRQQLGGAPVLLELPTDRPRPVVQDQRGAGLSFELDETLSSGIRSLARRHDSTLFMALLGSWAALLWRLSGQSEVVVGTPVAGRQRAEVEPLIGFFVNTLALRVGFDDQLSTGKLLEKVKATVLEGFAHQELPFEQVVDAVQPARSLSHTQIGRAHV